MQKSFKIQAAVALCSAILTVVGIALDIEAITKLPVSWLPLITFVVFCVSVWRMLSDLYSERSRLLNIRPSISVVEPTLEGRIYYLKVHNDGEKGFFKAQIQLEAEDDPSVWKLKNYTGYWKNSNKEGLEIMKGHDECIKIAELVAHTNSCSEYLKIWFFDHRLYAANCISSSSHLIGATVRNVDGEPRPMTKHEYKLEVTISADPSLREGVYKGRFRFNVDRLELDPDFQPSRHKANSQI
jgi:hypothetical protein